MDWGAIFIAVIGAVGLDRLIIYVDQRRARRRQAEAEASQGQAAARKIEAEARVIEADAESRTLDNAFRWIKHLECEMNELRQEVEAVKAENVQLREDIEGVKRENETLRRRLGRFAKRIAHLMDGISQLTSQIIKADQVPVWKPEEWNSEEGEDGP